MKLITCLIVVMAVFLSATVVQAEKIDSDGYIIDASVSSQCTDSSCNLFISGMVSGRFDCVILAVNITVVSENGTEAIIKAKTSRNQGDSPISGKVYVNSVGKNWKIKSIETSCDCN